MHHRPTESVAPSHITFNSASHSLCTYGNPLQQRPSPNSISVVKALQSFLRIAVLPLDHLDDGPDTAETFFAGEIGRVALLVFARAVVLDLFARVFDFGQAERCRGAFEEMSVRRELLEVAGFPVRRT